MHNLLQKMEAELNIISAQKEAVHRNPHLHPSRKHEALSQLEAKRQTLKRLINQYMGLQAQYLELIGALSINY